MANPGCPGGARAESFSAALVLMAEGDDLRDPVVPHLSAARTIYRGAGRRSRYRCQHRVALGVGGTASNSRPWNRVDVGDAQRVVTSEPAAEPRPGPTFMPADRA